MERSIGIALGAAVASLGFAMVACESTGTPAATATKPALASPATTTAPKPTKKPMPKTPDATASKPAKAPKAAATAAATQESLDEFQKLIRDFNITGEQAARITAKRDVARAGFAALDEAPEGKRQAAARAARDALKGSTDEAKVAAAEKEYKDAHGAYMAKRGALRAAVFNELNDEQRLAYVKQRLMGDIMKDYAKLQLTDEQIAKIKPLVDKAAPALVKPDMFDKDPYLLGIREAKEPVKEQIRATIMTPEQKEKSTPKPKEPKAGETKPATTK